MEIEYLKKIWRSLNFNPSNLSLGEIIFSKLNESQPDRVLEINHESDKSLTVKDIHGQTITVAKNLQRLGVNKGDTVILYSRSNTKITPITFACYAIGAPVNFVEVSLDDVAMSQYFELLNPTMILFEEEFGDKIFTILQHNKLRSLECVLRVDSDDLFEAHMNERDFRLVHIEDPCQHPATLIFTSGSTGKPKIVVLSHALMIQGLFNKWWPLEPGDIICSYCDLRWVVQVQMMLQPIFFGTKRVYTSRPELAIEVEEKISIINKHGITHFCEVPTYYLELLASAQQSKDSTSLSSLKIALVAGEVVTDALVDYSRTVIPNCKVIKCYGMTEVAGAVCTNELISKDDLNGGILKDGFFVKIIDDNGFSLGPNQGGRLCLKSTVPFLGYLKNDAANKKAFLEGGWYDTGDYACMDSDNLLCIGTRYHDLVRCSGIMVVPSIVESITNNHAGVLSSVFVGHLSDKNLKDQIGTLFVVLVSNHKRSNKIKREIMGLLKDHLSKEQLNIIRYIRFIPEIPLKACGKSDRNALKILADTLQDCDNGLKK